MPRSNRPARMERSTLALGPSDEVKRGLARELVRRKADVIVATNDVAIAVVKREARFGR